MDDVCGSFCLDSQEWKQSWQFSAQPMDRMAARRENAQSGTAMALNEKGSVSPGKQILEDVEVLRERDSRRCTDPLAVFWIATIFKHCRDVFLHYLWLSVRLPPLSSNHSSYHQFGPVKAMSSYIIEGCIVGEDKRRWNSVGGRLSFISFYRDRILFFVYFSETGYSSSVFFTEMVYCVLFGCYPKPDTIKKSFSVFAYICVCQLQSPQKPIKSVCQHSPMLSPLRTLLKLFKSLANFCLGCQLLSPTLPPSVYVEADWLSLQQFSNSSSTFHFANIWPTFVNVVAKFCYRCGKLL